MFCRSQGYYFYTRTAEGQQYRKHCRKKVPEGAAPPTERDMPPESEPEEVLLDENQRKQQGQWDFYMVRGATPCWGEGAARDFEVWVHGFVRV